MRQRRKYHSAPLYLPMIDLFVLTLMMMLLHRPVFGVQESLLPILQVAEDAAAPAKAPGEANSEACLRLDGIAVWNKETVPVDKLAFRIAQDTTEQHKVRFIVEVDAQGQGAMQNLLQFQVDAGRLGIGSRLLILRRPPTTLNQQQDFTAQKGEKP